jgi:hypothetical protein
VGKTKEKPERELMNAEEAADFIRMSYSEFRKRAPEFPRYAISERRYVYWRPELLEWVLRNGEANANEHKPTATYNLPDVKAKIRAFHA